MKRQIIFTNGCFDVLHRGHIELLRYCKTMGVVVVGLNSDKSVKQLKGIKRPIVNQEDRKMMLLALRYVDQVFIFDEATPIRIIEKIKPDVIVKDDDYKIEDVVGNHLAEVKLFKKVNGYSTTSIELKIKNNLEQQ